MADFPGSDNIFEIIIDRSFDLSIKIGSGALLVLALVVSALILIRVFFWRRNDWESFELDEAEFGIGDQKVKLKPNMEDRQIAYKIWVELSTRKIGLPIDLNNDVISEIYDSWYAFFSVTRELIKDVPVKKFRRKDTEQIIKLSIGVLNDGLRPHLTMWQARFRRWNDKQLANDEHAALHPQDIQKKFPDYESLEEELLLVNARLMNYRKSMYKLITGNKS